LLRGDGHRPAVGLDRHHPQEVDAQTHRSLARPQVSNLHSIDVADDAQLTPGAYSPRIAQGRQAMRDPWLYIKMHLKELEREGEATARLDPLRGRRQDISPLAGVRAAMTTLLRRLLVVGIPRRAASQGKIIATARSVSHV